MKRERKIKIAVLITAHGRRELFEICLEGLERVKKATGWIEFEVFVGTDDEDLYQIVKRYGCRLVQVENRPLGRKHNKLLRYALNFEWDYMMQMGSDDLLNQKYFDEVRWLFDIEAAAWGMKGLYFMDVSRGKAKKVMATGVFGAGRIIRREELVEAATLHLVRFKQTFGNERDSFEKGKEDWMNVKQLIAYKAFIEELDKEKIEFWDDSRERGLDTNSAIKLARTGVEVREVMVDNMVIDMKEGGVNLNPYDTIRGEEFDTDWQRMRWVGKRERNLIKKLKR